jgi:hypothetical protein
VRIISTVSRVLGSGERGQGFESPPMQQILIHYSIFVIVRKSPANFME